jgi:hypothetical protein
VIFVSGSSTAENTTNLQEAAQNFSRRNMLSSQPSVAKSQKLHAPNSRFIYLGFHYGLFPLRLVFIYGWFRACLNSVWFLVLLSGWFGDYLGLS